LSEEHPLRRLRRERLWTQAELARRARLVPRTITSIEAGARCRMDVQRRLLQALGLRLEDRERVFGPLDRSLKRQLGGRRPRAPATPAPGPGLADSTCTGPEAQEE
jgi:DNA-binding XRE family transcriptional regulator